MNLGLETALTPTGGMDAASTAAASPTPGSNGKGHPAAAVFGQLMAKALQQQAQGQGSARPADASAQAQPGAAGETPEAQALLAQLGALGTDTEAATDGEDEAGTASSPAQNAAVLGLPVWMPPLQGLPAVQQITVGPSLQAITGTAAPPDAQSLAAFARQQGLDTAAIAWLMNPTTRGGSDLPLPGAAPAHLAATPSLLAGLAAAPEPALLAQATTDPLPATAMLAGTKAARTDSQAAAGAAWPTAATSLGADLLRAGPTGLAGAAQVLPTPLQGAAAGPAPGQAPGATPTTPTSPTTPTLDAAGATSATVGLGAPGTLNTALMGQGSADPLGAAGAELGQLRWSQALAAAQANPQNLAGATVNLPATSTAWAEIGLDLSGDAGGAGDADPDTASDTPTQGGLGSPTLPTPLAADGQGLHKTQALAFQARLAAQTSLASGPGQGSDQMQQLSEKMADAIGERMLRELEKGQLNLRLSLKPAHLGHIEVEMRLRAGELDATFAAPQAATRELLQEGLARLRDSLAQAGMDVANLNVKNGQNRQNGGDSTAGQRQSAPKAAPSDAADSPVASVESTPRARRSDGWDVMV